MYHIIYEMKNTCSCRPGCLMLYRVCGRVKDPECVCVLRSSGGSPSGLRWGGVWDEAAKQHEGAARAVEQAPRARRASRTRPGLCGGVTVQKGLSTAARATENLRHTPAMGKTNS